MQLYFSPLACSMATRVAFYEAGVDAKFVEVDTETKRTLDGQDYWKINPLGMVPALRDDDGAVLFENAAVLQRVAARFPEANLAPKDDRGRAELQQWLCFIGTELHKAFFVPLLDKKAPEAMKAYALSKGTSRLDYLERHLAGREYLLDSFSVADAYLVTVLNWAQVTPVDLKRWPAVNAYLERLKGRPSIARAFSEEIPLYIAETQRERQRAAAAQNPNAS